jgi:hypothetical protein
MHTTLPRRDWDGLLLAGGVLLATLLTAGAVARGGRVTLPAPVAPFCLPDQTPVFLFGFKALAEELGDRMGQPIECEHGDRNTGDSLQRTTRGLAVYRQCTNTPMFSAGETHWALTASGVVEWSGPRPDPPVPLPSAHPPDLRRPCAGASG